MSEKWGRWLILLEFVEVGIEVKMVKNVRCGDVWEMYVTCMGRVGGTHDHDFKNSSYS